MAAYEPKMAKKRTVENCGTTYLYPKSKNNCTLFLFNFSKISPFSKYGRLKSKYLCERYSHCIYSSCSTELTKTRNTWSLTAVINKKASLWRSSSKRNTTKQQGWGPSLRGGRTFPERQLIQTDVLLITRGLPSSLNWNPMDHLDFTSK